MEVKVVCDCGQKYKFDVEPVNGQMPVKVNCPVCHADGTAAANIILSRMVSGQQPVSVAPAPQSAATPPPPAAAAVPSSSALRIDRPAPAPAAMDAPPPVQSAPAVITAMPSGAPAARNPKAGGEFSLGMGILGAVLGAALGAVLMYGFFLWADFRFPFMGTSIGALSGLGARLLARGTDTKLGVIAGSVALISTAGTLYFMFGDLAAMFIVSMIVSVFFAYRIAG